MRRKKIHRKKTRKTVSRAIQAISAERYQQLISKLGFSQRGAARFLGINERTCRHYIAGDNAVDPRTGMLLELIVKHRISPASALESIGISINDARLKAIEEAERRATPPIAPRFYEDRKGVS